MKYLIISILFMMAACRKDQIKPQTQVADNIILEQACGNLDSELYPDQQKDDYLHEERFENLPKVVILTEQKTARFLSHVLPVSGDPLADLCNVRLILTDEITEEQYIFYDIFNAYSDMFNANKEIKALNPDYEGAHNFLIEVTRLSTQDAHNYDTNYTLDPGTVLLNFEGL